MYAFSKSESGYTDSAISSPFEARLFVSVPASLLLRDAMYRMNERFATAAAVVNDQGRVIGWLTQSLLTELFEVDADQALRSPCHTLLGFKETCMAA